MKSRLTPDVRNAMMMRGIRDTALHDTTNVVRLKAYNDALENRLAFLRGTHGRDTVTNDAYDNLDAESTRPAAVASDWGTASALPPTPTSDKPMRLSDDPVGKALSAGVQDVVTNDPTNASRLQAIAAAIEKRLAFLRGTHGRDTVINDAYDHLH